MTDAYMRLSAFARDDLRRALDGSFDRSVESLIESREEVATDVWKEVTKRFDRLLHDAREIAVRETEFAVDRGDEVAVAVGSARDEVSDELAAARLDRQSVMDHLDLDDVAERFVGELAALGWELRPIVRVVPRARAPRVRRLRRTA